MHEVEGLEYTRIPEAWRDISFFGRVVKAGLCAYDKIRDGTLSIKDVFDMHRMLDLEIYIDAKAANSNKSSANEKRFEEMLEPMFEEGAAGDN